MYRRWSGAVLLNLLFISLVTTVPFEILVWAERGKLQYKFRDYVERPGDAEIVTLAERFAHCAGIAHIRVIVVGSKEYARISAHPDGMTAQIATQNLSGLAFGAPVLVFFNRDSLAVKNYPENVVRHEIGHHLYEPTIYHKVWHGLQGMWTPPQETDSEFWASILGDRLLCKNT